MKRILLMAVAMVAIFFQGQAKTENEIKLISYNIRTAWGRDGNNSWDYRKTATSGLFQNESPDEIGLQEAMKCQLDYMITHVRNMHMLEKIVTVGLKAEKRWPSITEKKSSIFWIMELSGSVNHRISFQEDGMRPATGQ